MKWVQLTLFQGTGGVLGINAEGEVFSGIVAHKADSGKVTIIWRRVTEEFPESPLAASL